MKLEKAARTVDWTAEEKSMPAVAAGGEEGRDRGRADEPTELGVGRHVDGEGRDGEEAEHGLEVGQSHGHLKLVARGLVDGRVLGVQLGC